MILKYMVVNVQISKPILCYYYVMYKFDVNQEQDSII